MIERPINTNKISKAVIVIPARLDSQRLPHKPLADINGIPMIVRVWQQAIKANVGPVIVACCGPEIRDVIEAQGGIAIETAPNLPSGTDRVLAALQTFDPEGIYQFIINLQGDLPTIDPQDIRAVLTPLESPHIDISSLCCEVTNREEITNPNVVKVATSFWKTQGRTPTSRAIYFSRQAIPANAQTYYHHIGIYGFKRDILEIFVQLPVSYLEKTEKLEQLRALEAGMHIGMALIKTIPRSIDTLEDLTAVCQETQRD